MPRFVPKCYRWDGAEIPFEVLQSRYGFTYHEGTDHLPVGTNKAWYPVQLREAHGKAYFVAVASGAAIRMEVPPEGYTESDGHVVHPMTSQDYSYFPGQHGLIGCKVIDRYPSVYVDGFGILYGGHRPEDLPPPDKGNNYMHVDITWGLVDIERIGTVPPTQPSDPTPITGGIWLTADDVQRLRGSLLNVDDILRNATNRKPQ